MVKNTFLNIALPEEKALARITSSAPPTTWWCPALQSDESTSASESESSFMTCSFGNGNTHCTHSSGPGAECIAADVESTVSDAHVTFAFGTWDIHSPCSSCLNAGCMAEEAESSVSNVQPTFAFGNYEGSYLGLNAGCVADEKGSAASDKLPASTSSGKVTLCLDASITSTFGASALEPQTRLNAKAPAFAPVATVSDEIMSLVESVREVLQGSPDVLSVKVSDVAMGGTTTVLAEVRSSCQGSAIAQQTLSLLKSTLLNTASDSETTYILGYGAQPFQDTSSGFKATIGCVNALQEHSVCWDIYELGFCARRNSCRWCHPKPSDLMQLVVVLKDVHETHPDEIPQENA